jgi:hypothetical protein
MRELCAWISVMRCFRNILNGSAMPDAGIRSGRDIMEMQFGVS